MTPAGPRATHPPRARLAGTPRHGAVDDGGLGFPLVNVGDVALALGGDVLHSFVSLRNDTN